MSRIVAIGLTVLVLTACKPVEPAAPAVAASAPQPMTATSWEATQARYRQLEVAPSDPLEALEWRGVLCEHYAGEFGGDGSERDRWLKARMDTLRCGEDLTAEARALREARSGDPVVVARLDAVLAASGE